MRRLIGTKKVILALADNFRGFLSCWMEWKAGGGGRREGGV